MNNIDFTWDDILQELNEEYHHFHDNSPKIVQELTESEINRFGEFDWDVYDNLVLSSLYLTEGKYLVNEAEFATYPAQTSIDYISKSLNIPKGFLTIGTTNNDVEFINAVLLNKRNVLANVEKAMHLCGYYKAKEFYYNGDSRLIYRKYQITQHFT